LFGKQSAGRAPLDQRRGERELFFWTAFKCVQLVVAVALAVYLIVSLATGHDPVAQGFKVWK
jgi:hypothetical protein